MDDFPSLLTGHRHIPSQPRVQINIHPDVRKRLQDLLYSDAFIGTGVGYSAFIDRACEAAETERAIFLRRKRREDCRCWNEGQYGYGRVHREDCPIHKGGS